MKTLLLAAAAALCAGAAQASIIPVLVNVTDNHNGTFTFNYTATLAADQGLVSTGPTPSELVIFDFAGYVPGSIASASSLFTASTELTSALPLPPTKTDNPAITNLVWTYNGPAYRNTGGPAGTSTDFTGLSALSTFGLSSQGAFSALAVKNSGAQANTLTLNQGFVNVPVSGGVPEPASWALMIMGFGGIGTMLRRRRYPVRSAVAA